MSSLRTVDSLTSRGTAGGETGAAMYNLPFIPGDLRNEECIHHISDALDYLNRVADDLITRVEKRVKLNSGHLRRINQRVEMAQKRVDSLKDSKKATQVFSCAKYPADSKPTIYQSIFTGVSCIGGFLPEMTRQKYHLTTKHEILDPFTLKGKLQFCNVHVHLKRNEEEATGEGLGRLPKDVDSVSALLLFNTSENPYKKYLLLDPLGVTKKTRAVSEETSTNLADAPSSIKIGEQLQHPQADNYSYVPDIGNVPEISVPDFLPELLGVADDLSYTADQGPSIAPSVFSAIPDLPLPSEFSLSPPHPFIGTAFRPLAPGPTPQPAPVTSTPTVPLTLRPPPPPPMPPVTPNFTPSDPEKDLPSVVSSPPCDRANLLEAIRRAGDRDGVMLKKVERKKEKTKVEVQVASGEGDLMSDLFNKLTMRRKGISGTKKEEQKGPVYNSLAPPPKPNNAACENGQKDDDDDWD